MKVASPTSVPEGVRLSAGMMVSTAALMKADSVGFSVCHTSGSAGAVAAVFVSGLHALTPVAMAAPAAPTAPALFKKSRRGIFTSAIYFLPGKRQSLSKCQTSRFAGGHGKGNKSRWEVVRYTRGLSAGTSGGNRYAPLRSAAFGRYALRYRAYGPLA